MGKSMAGVPPKAADVRNTLIRMAYLLDGLARSPTASLPQSKQCTLYAPFARELAKRQKFCLELADIVVDDPMPLDEIGVELRPLLEKYRFPSVPPFDFNDWAEMLTWAHFGSQDFVPRSFYRFPVKLEVQFQHQREGRAKHGASDDVPTRSVKLSVHRALGKTQLRALLSREMVGPLGHLRRQIHTEAKLSSDPIVIVRLITPQVSSRRGGQAAADGDSRQIFTSSESIVHSFPVELRNGRNNVSVVKEIFQNLGPRIEPLVGSTVAPGRRYNAEVRARWWAMRRLDGMTVRKIADHESINYSSQVDEETVRKALKRMEC